MFLAACLPPIVELGRRYHVPFIGLAIGSAFLWSWLDWNDNHEVRGIAGKPPLSPPSIDAAFHKWLAARGDREEFGTKPYPVFLVAAEGGGLRAAYFTALVLEQLQARCARFAQHTFLISGVSGGSVGAALFAEALRHHGARNEPGLPCSTSEKAPGAEPAMHSASRALRADLLSPLLVGMLGPDLLQRLVPYPFEFLDRAGFLERALEQAWAKETVGGELDKVSFYAVWQGADAVPALMLNTTNVETGHRMIVSHLSFPKSRTDLPSLFEVNPDLNIPLSTAAFLSARFPLITPAGTVKVLANRDGAASPRKARYVDGGYFENSGLATILDAVEALAAAAAAVVGRKVRWVIISIETSAATTSYRRNAADETTYPGFAFGELLSPLRALLNTRQARGDLAKLETERAVKGQDHRAHDALRRIE
jgi:hypothetical protein